MRIIKTGLILSLSNIASGFLAYLYQILMGRFLTPYEFGSLSAMMALIGFCSSPLGAIFMVVSRTTGILFAGDHKFQISHFYRKSIIFVAMIVAIGIGSAFMIRTPLMRLIKTDSLWFFLIALISLFFVALSVVSNGVMQGLQRFLAYGLSGFASILLKTFLSLIFIIFGYGLIGAISGYLVSSVIIFIWGFWFCKLELAKYSYGRPNFESTVNLKTALPVLLANIAFASMTQLDMVIVNWYFDSKEAGLYAAASVLGKAVLYLPGGLVLAMFPFVVDAHAKKESTIIMLRQVVLTTFFICVAAAIIYFLFAEEIIIMLYGSSYLNAASVLKWYGFAMLPLALTLIAENYLIAKGKTLFVWIFMAIAPFQIFAIHLWHADLMQIVIIMGVCGAALLMVGYSLLLKPYVGKISQTLSG